MADRVYGVLGDDGVIVNRFTTQAGALRSAKRFATGTQLAHHVVWLKDGVPKIWLANVDVTGGVTLTEFWHVGTDR